MLALVCACVSFFFSFKFCFVLPYQLTHFQLIALKNRANYYANDLCLCVCVWMHVFAHFFTSAVSKQPQKQLIKPKTGMGEKKNSFMFAYFLWLINGEMLSAHNLKCVHCTDSFLKWADAIYSNVFSSVIFFLLRFLSLSRSRHFTNFIAIYYYSFPSVIVAINIEWMYIACAFFLSLSRQCDEAVVLLIVFVYWCACEFAFSTTIQCRIYSVRFSCHSKIFTFIADQNIQSKETYLFGRYSSTLSHLISVVGWFRI